MFKNRSESAGYIRRITHEKGGRVLELSPDINPIVVRTPGVDVEYLDACSTETLRERAVSKGRKPDSVAAVDHLLDYKKPISECVDRRTYDCLVSSHVIEHIPDLIGHFNQASDVLNPTGIYAFLAPDKELCFDCRKPDTSLGQLIEAHIYKKTSAPTSAMIDEFYYGAQRGSKGGWSVDDKEPLRNKHGQSKDLIKSVISNPDKAENWHGHIWRFTPSTFKSLYQELFFLDLVKLELVDVIPTQHMEFVVVLRSRA